MNDHVIARTMLFCPKQSPIRRGDCSLAPGAHLPRAQVPGSAGVVAGKLLNSGPTGRDQVSHVTPAPEIPTTTPEVSGLLVERKDNTLILQTVSFDPGSGWRLGDSNAPMDASSGPKVEVIVTGETIIYRDNFEFSQSSIQQMVEETTLDYLDSQMLITVWGRNNGDRVIADIILAQHLKE